MSYETQVATNSDIKENNYLSITLMPKYNIKQLNIGTCNVN